MLQWIRGLYTRVKEYLQYVHTNRQNLYVLSDPKTKLWLHSPLGRCQSVYRVSTAQVKQSVWRRWTRKGEEVPTSPHQTWKKLYKLLFLLPKIIRIHRICICHMYPDEILLYVSYHVQTSGCSKDCVSTFVSVTVSVFTCTSYPDYSHSSTVLLNQTTSIVQVYMPVRKSDDWAEARHTLVR